MSEPEDVILDGAHHATLFAQRLWRRRTAGREPETLRLVEVKGRVELFVGAAFGLPLILGPAEAPAAPNFFLRLGRRIPRHLVERRFLASTDGVRLRLPPELPALRSPDESLTKYRLLASESAARAARRTPEHLPADPLTRDLYLIREAAAIDRWLAGSLPGLLPVLRAAREEARKTRPSRPLLTAREAFVEAEILALLTADPAAGPDSDDPAASLAWAREMAARAGENAGPYRGLPAVEVWGLVAPPPAAGRIASVPSAEEDVPSGPLRVGQMRRRPKVRQAADDEDDQDPGIWMIQLDDPQEHVEDPMGLQRPTDRDDDADSGDLADSLSELPEARLVTSPGRPREVLASDDPPPPGVAEVARGGSGSKGLVYPEWDYRAGGYHEHGAMILERVPPVGDPAWAEAVLTRRAALLHEVRRRFERLRPRRRRFGRQPDGPEIDLAAYVASHADRRAGCPADDRLYQSVRPARRDVAIALLVDVSGSTDSWVSQNLRVIDVEKEALLVVCSALDALGDPYTILGFSGEGPERVSILPLKSFDERNGPAVHRRIAALEPERYTRMGAALRHATARLMTKPAEHRLLLLLSDGKPNDVDCYEGRYGVEDARQSVVEARLQGIHPFCVTVDRHAPSYMPRIFGAGGYAALHRPERLPDVLVDVLRRLVKA